MLVNKELFEKLRIILMTLFSRDIWCFCQIVLVVYDGGNKRFETKWYLPFSAEVGFMDVRVFQELSGVAGEDDFAGFKQIAAVGKVEREFGVLFDEKNGHAVFVEFF